MESGCNCRSLSFLHIPPAHNGTSGTSGHKNSTFRARINSYPSFRAQNRHLLCPNLQNFPFRAQKHPYSCPNQPLPLFPSTKQTLFVHEPPKFLLPSTKTPLFVPESTPTPLSEHKTGTFCARTSKISPSEHKNPPIRARTSINFQYPSCHAPPTSRYFSRQFQI